MKLYRESNCSNCVNIAKLEKDLKYMRSLPRILIYMFLAMLVGYGIGFWLDKNINQEVLKFSNISWFGLLGSFVAFCVVGSMLRYEIIGIKVYAYLDQSKNLHVHTTPPDGSIKNWQKMRVTNNWHRPCNQRDTFGSNFNYINGAYLALSLGGRLRWHRRSYVINDHYFPWSIFRANTLDDIIVKSRDGSMIGGLSLGDLLVVINQVETAKSYVHDVNLLRMELEKLGHATTATIHYLRGSKGRTPSRMAAKGREMLTAGISSLTLNETEEVIRWTRSAEDVAEDFIKRLEKHPPTADNPNPPKPKLTFLNILERSF